MAVFLNEIKPLTIYHGKFCYPINKKNKEHGSIIYLITPHVNATIRHLSSYMQESVVNSTLFKSYFTEKNVDFIIHQKDGKLTEDAVMFNIVNTLSINNESIRYSGSDYTLLEDVDYKNKNISFNEDNNIFFSYDDTTDTRYRFYFPDYVEDILNEDLMSILEGSTINTKYDQLFKKILYNKRMVNQQDIINLYADIKTRIPSIKYTFVDPKLYKEKNLIYDWSYYTNTLFNSKERIHLNYNTNLDLLYTFFNRFFHDKRFSSYTHHTIIIPVNDWNNPNDNIMEYKTNITPTSMLVRLLHTSPEIVIPDLKDHTIIFMGDNNRFFKLDLRSYKASEYGKFVNALRKLITLSDQADINITDDSKDVILANLASKFDSSGIKINNLTSSVAGKSEEELSKSGLLDNPDCTDNTDIKKAALVNKLAKTAAKSKNAEDALNSLEYDSEEDKQWMSELLLDLQSEEGVKMDKVRAARHDKTQKELMSKVINGQTVKQMLEHFARNDDIPETEIPVDSIDDHWKHVKFPNFNEVYTKQDMQADIMAMFYHFTNVTHPMNIININVVNNSTTEDYIETWTCNYEDAETGKRYTMKLDMPIMIDNRFMRLRGNEKVLIGQLMLLPIVKTDNDTVQVVSNYNKIFVRRKSPSGAGKSTPIVNKLFKVFDKYTGNEFKVTPGDNSKVCSKYKLPISFVDLASQYTVIRFKDKSYIDFNMDNLNKIPFDRSYLPDKDKKLDEDVLAKKYIGVYIKDGKREPIVDVDKNIDEYILDKMCEMSKDFVDLYNVTPVTKRLMYSEASILASKIPVVVVCSYSIGLQRVMERAGIKYEFSEKRPNKNQPSLKFNDGYLLYYPRSDADNMFMNGMMQVDTEEFSIKEINSKDMWLAVLDDFGGRVKADGLDNFYDLMMDPITVEICKSLHLPEDYIGALIYANNLLTDNTFNRHADLSGNRLRINEIIVGHLYQVLSKEFGRYRNMIKRNKGQATFSAKQSAVIDSVLTHDQTSSDLSTLTPLLEAESANKVTFKGLSGMNSERAFSMEKRAYDESMLGVLSLSTGFSNTVGINRQTTIDAGILNKRGFIASKKPKDLDNLSTLSVMEAMAGMSTNHNDGMRSAMLFTQMVSHGVAVRKAIPNLITTGMDEALPHITGNKFSYKFRGKRGKVIDLTDEYMVVQDLDTKEKDFIDLREKIQKNSDGGFYITTKLDANANIKKGSMIKQNDILAYNPVNYSAAIGNGSFKDPNNISYNLGSLFAVCVANMDLSFEDSCVVDEYVSEALSAEICFEKDISLSPTSNVYTMVEIGQPVEEGDPLIIFTDSFEDEDANEMLISLVKDNNSVLSDIGRKQVHSKVSGVVQDIKFYRTVEVSKLSPSLQKAVRSYENRINKLKKVMENNGISKTYELEPTSKLPMEGKLKNVDGVRIEFYIKTIDKYGVGDKMVFGPTGLKGVNSFVIPKEDACWAEYFGEKEKVSAFLTCSGIGARMTPNAFTMGLLNKALLALIRQCQEAMGIVWRPIQEIMTDFKK